MTGPPGLQFRNATPDDADGLMQVLRAFPGTRPDTPEWRTRREAVRTQAAQWRVGVLDGQLVSAIHVTPGAVWFGRSRVRWADVGDVSVLPELQGRGLGSQAMRDVVEWLPRGGFGVSRLGGLVRFYRRFGYEVFPRQYVEFPIPKTIAAGASRVPFVDVLKPTAEAAGDVRPVESTCDHPAVWKVIEAHNRHRTGSRIMQRPADDALPPREGIVYEDAGTIRGFASYRLYPHETLGFEGRLTAYLLAYEPGCTAALESLVKHLLRLAHQAGATRMTALLPPDAATRRDLPHLDVDYHLCQAMGQAAGNMVRIVSLWRLLNDMAEELAVRLTPIGWRGRIGFETADQQAAVAFDGERVRVTEVAPSDLVLTLTQAQLLAAVLGVEPMDWGRWIEPGHPARPALAAMFPPRFGGYTS